MSNQEKYHPDFNSEDADICLTTKDNVNFLTYTFLLRKSSTLFRDTLSLPQPTDRKESRQTRRLPSAVLGPLGPELNGVPRIHLDEESGILEIVLRMISFMDMPIVTSLDTIEDLLRTLDKFDMPSPRYLVQNMIVQDRFLSGHPLRVYKIATQYGWKEEAKAAALSSLGHDIFTGWRVDQKSRAILDTLDGKALLDLMYLHLKKKNALQWYVCAAAPCSKLTRREILGKTSRMTINRFLTFGTSRQWRHWTRLLAASFDVS
jgi:hypothetical protein